jgi:hypothetical protein
MEFEEEVIKVCHRGLEILGVKELRFRPMKRLNNRVNTKHGFVIGRTNLKTGLITIDIFTPNKREPKKISAILKVLCHEIAHHQKPPFRQMYRWKWITRQHYPEFYQQVTKNIELLKGDKELSKYFI